MNLINKHLLFVCLLFSSICLAQNNFNSNDTQQKWPGLSCHAPKQDNLKTPSPQNGNATLGPVYNLTKCGLNFVQASVKLGQRYSISCCPSTPGVVQPASFVISGLPTCGVIEKAYLWALTSGNGIGINASITNPASQNQVFPMTQVGTDADKCWGFNATYTYRADVTSIINGNGNYVISGLPTSTTQSGNDTDGATLFIVYSNPTQTYQGEIYLFDGCFVGIGSTNQYNLTGFNACAQSTAAEAFMAVADLQQINSSFVLNGGAPFQIGMQEDWYNWIQQPTIVNAGQTTSNFQVQASGDCYNLGVAGLYFQTTTCTTCTFQANINIQSTTTPASCGSSNGTVTANPSGGQAPYTYSWTTTPPQTTQTATGLSPGQYIVYVQDASGCYSGIDTITITQSGGTAVTSAQTDVLCNGGLTGTATATPNGGQSPYTYLWTPSGGTNATATGLAAGTYTVTITDAQGCTDTSIVIITQPPVLASIEDSLNVLCSGGNSGAAWVNTSGGVGPYTYSWNTVPVQTTDSVGNLTAGNYTVFITDANGCAIQKVFNIGQPQPLVVVDNFIPATCGLNDGTAGVTVTGGTGSYTYLWTPGNQTTASATGLANGSYTVVVTDANGCSQSVSMNINNVNFPNADFTVTPGNQPLSDPNFSFNNLSSNATTYTWLFGDPNDTTVSYAQNPTHQYSDTGTYCITLIVSNTVCTDTFVNCIVVEPEMTIFVPNAFTPNDDGKNDVFMPEGTFVGDFEMWIYDRWGNMIFKSTSVTQGWDGKANGGSKLAQQDVYVWKIRCIDPQKRKREYVGHVSLIK
jgi:gliding motility-associated-like protein